MMEVDRNTIITAALEARDKAISPYSEYPVGAALVTGSGEIITAGNIESSTYGLTMCAERIALFSALSRGYREFSAIAIATEDGASPCGACRQLLWEFAGDCVIYLVGPAGKTETRSLSELFPSPFDQRNLSGTGE